MVQVKEKEKRERFTLDMTPELRLRLKIAAARKGMTMRDYSIAAIEHHLRQDELKILVPGKFSIESLQKARAFQESAFKEGGLSEDSVDTIRQAREERVVD